MAIEDRIKTVIGNLVVTLEMAQLRIEELERQLAEKQGPHPIRQEEFKDAPAR